MRHLITSTAEPAVSELVIAIRMKIIPQIDTSDGNRQEIYSLPIDTDFLEGLLRYIFENH